MPDIHSTAIVSSKAEIAGTASIGPFATVEADVVIGEGTSVGPHCRIDDGARIGANCRIHQGAVISTPPQDLKYAGEKTEFHLGDNTTVREYATLNRGTTHSYKSAVGSNCLVMAYAHVAHDCMIGDNVILANSVQMGGHVIIGSHAIVGGLTAIHQFVHIGDHCMVSGLVQVPKDIPPYILAAKSPARFEGLNSIGLRRRGFSRGTLETLNRVYDTLYYSGRNISDALGEIKRSFEMTDEVRTVVDFIENADRGLIKAVPKGKEN